MDVFNLPTGLIVILVTLMAIFMFWGGEKLEAKFGGKDPKNAPKLRYYGATVLIILAISVAIIGQPTTLDKWDRLSVEKQPLLDQRRVQVHPGELLHTIHDHKINLIMLDVRSEADYNLFHIRGAENSTPDKISGIVNDLIQEPANTVIVIMSNDETASTEVWKFLTAESVPNIYILDGGINGWLDTFAGEFEEGYCAGQIQAGNDELRYNFTAALGSGCPAAYPHEEDFELVYESKIILELKRAPSGGGCG